MSVKRYIMCYDSKDESPYGEWVQYKDYAALESKVDELLAVIQMCFNDACKPSGKISKKTAIELMKHADTRI